jgi:tetratricopeptide (TPR) repeat protein
MMSPSAMLVSVDLAGSRAEPKIFPRPVAFRRWGAIAVHFISYSHVDGGDFAQRLCLALRDGSPPEDVFIDADIPLGQPWDFEVSDAIDECDTLLFVMTRDSVRRQSACIPELDRALDFKKTIIPLRLHADARKPLLLGTRQWLDVSDDFDAAVGRLRQHFAWFRSGEGEIRTLEDQLADLERAMARQPGQRDALQRRIAYLRRRIEERKRIHRDPKVAARRAAMRIDREQSREREEGFAGTGRRRARVVNEPPPFTADYFQDRRHETNTLAEYLRNDAVRLVVVRGPEGLGKTAMTCRLLVKVIRRESPENGPIRLDGVVYERVDRRPLSARMLLTDLAKLLPDDVRAELAQVFRDPRARLAAQVDRLLEALGGRRVVVLLDAAQDLIDPPSLKLRDPDLDELLRSLLDPDRRHGVKVVITSRLRPEPLMGAHPSAQRELALDEGLPSPYAEELLRDLDADGSVGLKAAPEEQLGEARRRTGGNPFALGMLYAVLKADPMVTLHQLLTATADLSTQQVIDEFLAREAVGRLDPTERAVVEALAIYQVAVRPGAVEHLLPAHLRGIDSRPVLDQLAGTQLVRQDGPLYQLPQKYWRRALARIPFGDPASAELEPYTQLALLRRGADYFADARRPPEMWRDIPDLAPQRVEFGLRVRGQDYATAAELLLLIGHKLVMWGSGKEVRDGYQALIDKLVEDPELAQACVGSLGNAHFYLREYRDAVRCYKRAIRLAESFADPTVANRWVVGLASAYYELGQTKQALEKYEDALGAAQGHSRDEERWSLAGLSLCESDRGRFELALRYAQDALEIARGAEDSALESDLLPLIGHLHGVLEQPDQLDLATRQLNRALELARGRGDRSLEIQCLADLAELLVDLGDSQAAIDLCHEALELNRALGEPRLAREAGYVLALAYLCQDAEAEARLAIDQARLHSPKRWTLSAPALQGIVMLRQRDPEARDAFQAAIAEAEVLLDGGHCFFAHDVLGLAQLGLACCGDEGRLAEAKVAFAEARGMTAAPGVIRRLDLLLEQFAVAGNEPQVDAVRPVATGAAAEPTGVGVT